MSFNGKYEKYDGISLAVSLTISFVLFLFLSGRSHIIGTAAGILLAIPIVRFTGKARGFYYADYQKVTFIYKRHMSIYMLSDISFVTSESHYLRDTLFHDKVIWETELTITDTKGDTHTFSEHRTFPKKLADNSPDILEDELSKTPFRTLPAFIELMKRVTD